VAISFTRYVDINSALLSAGNIPGAVLELRLITDNTLTPTQTILQFSSAAQVGEYYGTSSVEYSQASYYFSYQRPLFRTSPSTISFAFWPQVATVPLIFGTKSFGSIIDFNAINDGAFKLTLGTDTLDVTGLDFTLAVSLADVADIVETAIQAASALPVWAGAAVLFGTDFELLGGIAGAAPVNVQSPDSGTDITALLGWTANAVYSYGAAALSLTDYLTQLTDVNDQFGSLAFTFEPTTDDNITAAEYFAQNAYRFAVLTERTAATDVTTYTTALSGDEGKNAAFTLRDVNLTTEYPWLLPAAEVAAINYDQSNSVTNFMFKYNGSTPLVTSDSDANYYDNLRINYVGQTQKNGATINFYQRGYAIGTDDGSIIDLGVAYNEIWLNKSLSAALGNVLLDNPSVPAQQRGIAIVTAALQGVIDQALTNGVISVGNIFSNAKKFQIASLTGVPDGWITVQTEGYYLKVYITEPSPEVFNINYLLVYGKNNSVRKIEGSDIIA